MNSQVIRREREYPCKKIKYLKKDPKPHTLKLADAIFKSLEVNKQLFYIVAKYPSYKQRKGICFLTSLKFLYKQCFQ